MNEFSLKMLGEGEAEQEEVTYVQASGGTLWRTRMAPAVKRLLPPDSSSARSRDRRSRERT